MDRVTELQLQTHNLAKLMADSIGYIQQNAPASEDVGLSDVPGTVQPETVSKEQLTTICKNFATDISLTTDAIVQHIASIPPMETEADQVARIMKLNKQGHEKAVQLREKCSRNEALLEKVRAAILAISADSLASSRMEE